MIEFLSIRQDYIKTLFSRFSSIQQIEHEGEIFLLWYYEMQFLWFIIQSLLPQNQHWTSVFLFAMWYFPQNLKFKRYFLLFLPNLWVGYFSRLSHNLAALIPEAIKLFKMGLSKFSCVSCCLKQSHQASPGRTFCTSLTRSPHTVKPKPSWSFCTTTHLWTRPGPVRRGQQSQTSRGFDSTKTCITCTITCALPRDIKR